jgi:hypothetical protein
VSTPPTLDLPPGVESTILTTARGDFAALRTTDRPSSSDGSGHARHVARSIVLLPGWTGSKEDFVVLLPLLAERGWDAVA